jgi:hypothetical protein
MFYLRDGVSLRLGESDHWTVETALGYNCSAIKRSLLLGEAPPPLPAVAELPLQSAVQLSAAQRSAATGQVDLALRIFLFLSSGHYVQIVQALPPQQFEVVRK